MSMDNTNTDSGIKAMMSEVIAHITDADRRSTASLRQMQERLEALGQETRAARHGVPSDYLPGFERIEDGMTLLANRIAQSYAARQQVAPCFAAHQAPAVHQAPVAPSPLASLAKPAFASVATTPVEPAPQKPEAYVPVAPSIDVPPVVPHMAQSWHDHNQPNPLSSTSPGLLRARPKSYAPNVDTFDVIETLPDTSAEPWSPDQAAALVDLYTGSEAVLPLPQPITPEPAPAATSLAGNDKAWLDARLSDIATRVEQSLAASRSDKAIASMELRLEEFEQRLLKTLGGVATRGDVEALVTMERQIHDLRAQFEITHTELMRIDDLEHQLAHIAQQTSHDELGTMMSRFVPEAKAESAAAVRTDVEFHSIAIAAAEAAASRVANANRDTKANGRVDDVHAMLADFIQERRQGDEQTAITLDTLQQAMLRILDRVDTIDAGPMPHNVPAAVYADQSTDYVGLDEHPDQARPPLKSAPAAPYETEEVAQPVPAGDYLAQQRAKMQASVQRAAAAQREKQKAQQEAGDQKPVSQRPAKPATPGGSRRLMVSSLALAVVAGGVGAFAMMSSPRDQAAIATSPGVAPATASPLSGKLSRPKPLATTALSTTPPNGAQSDTADQAASGAPQAAETQTAHIVPETVTSDLTDGGGTAQEIDRVPDAHMARTNMARNQTPVPAPMSGIMLQGEPAPESQTASSANSLPVLNATQIAANATDLEMAKQQPLTSGGQPRAALDLPPATVGPLSLRLAAAQGDMSAEFEVASRLAEGKGTDQNLKEAVRWYQRSATQGFAQAQYRLGTFYERGLGMKVDVARARSWYQRAADQGNVKAMHNLAVLAAGRSAESPDYNTAVRWFTQAAGYGLPDSQFNLAVLTESGLGVEKDMVQAAMWFTIAARSGDKEAMRRRDLMKTKLDATSLAAADHLVKTWQQLVPEKMANDPRAAGEAWKTRQAASPEQR
ncbi:MAG: hypothetical protein ABL901_09755 [Hyphomicrobiaceae bacterium]